MIPPPPSGGLLIILNSLSHFLIIKANLVNKNPRFGGGWLE